MKDFDEERNARPRLSVEERTFKIGGEVFVARDRIRPDALAPMDDLPDAEFDHTTCSCDHRLHEHPQGPCTAVGCDCKKFRPKLLKSGATLAEQLAAMDTTFVALIESGDDAEARYRALRARNDDALELDDIMEVIGWVTVLNTRRPTGPSVDSPGGPASTGTASTGVSSSPGTLAA